MPLTADAHRSSLAEQLELAWAAGFFDGEGCTTITRVTPPRNNPKLRGLTYSYVRVSINQVNPDPLIRFKAAVGVPTNIRGPYQRKNPNHSPVYKISLTNYKAIAVLRALWPYLCNAKKAQARRVILTCRR